MLSFLFSVIKITFEFWVQRYGGFGTPTIAHLWHSAYPWFGMRFTIPMGLWYQGNRRTFAPDFKTQTIMAKIYVNGDAQEVSLPLNVSELIKQLLVENPEMVSVQVNEEFAEREDWDSIQIKEGDKVDFLYFMGGGAL